jgi:hypothetical protein
LARWCSPCWAYFPPLYLGKYTHGHCDFGWRILPPLRPSEACELWDSLGPLAPTRVLSLAPFPQFPCAACSEPLSRVSVSWVPFGAAEAYGKGCAGLAITQRQPAECLAAQVSTASQRYDCPRGMDPAATAPLPTTPLLPPPKRKASDGQPGNSSFPKYKCGPRQPRRLDTAIPLGQSYHWLAVDTSQRSAAHPSQGTSTPHASCATSPHHTMAPPSLSPLACVYCSF